MVKGRIATINYRILVNKEGDCYPYKIHREFYEESTIIYKLCIYSTDG
jgi:hypothetical protein